MTDDDRPRLADLRDVDEVYQPADDSHLLAETASSRIDADSFVLDVGTGSGYVAEYIREQTGAKIIGVDLNPEATREAQRRDIPVVRGDLLTPFCESSFDIICFNPPYLPTPADVEWNDWMEHALSGGENGRAVIGRFLDDVGRVLRENGVVYLLVSTLTGPEELREAAQQAEFVSETIAEESYPFEKLLVLELSRTE